MRVVGLGAIAEADNWEGDKLVWKYSMLFVVGKEIDLYIVYQPSRVGVWKARTGK